MKCLNPDTQLLCKIGSIIVHAEEGLSSEGHAFDMVALKQMIDDEDVVEWLREMGEMALIPQKR